MHAKEAIMRFRIFSLLAITFVLGACDTNKTAVEKTVVGPNATDDQKFAYMLGAQFGAQFAMIAKQFEAPAEEELFILGSSEAQKMMTDTSFHLQLPDDTLRLVGQRFQENARKLQEIAKTSPTPPPVKPEIPALNKYPATISLTSSDNDKFAYMLGVQFGTQFVLLGKEFNAPLDEKFFIQGIRDARVMRADSTQHMQLSEDTLRAVSTRYQKKAQELRAEAQKKAMEEQKEIETEVAPLRGDTLPDGLPTKINFRVKVTGVSVESSDLQAYAGKPLFIFYFSTTCGHCRHATPEIQKIASEFSALGLTTLAIASGGNNKRDIRAFAEEFKLENMVMLFDESRQFGQLYGDGYVPKIYLVKPDGSYILYKDFTKDLPQMRSDIAALLKKK